MTGSGNKVEFIVLGEDAKKLLKDISDSVSSIQTEPAEKYAIDFSRLKKLKLSIKTESGQTSVKCMIAYGRDTGTLTNSPDAPQPTGDKPDFNVLKKRMDKIFKIIGDRLKAGELPSSLETDLFCRNAELMITYAGYGDNMYGDFLNLVVEFENAFRRSSIRDCREKFDAIRTMKTRCHKVLPP
ncbi:MAG: GAK system XXXCH domain-containing protein [Pseudomonadota bacterium]